MSQSQDDLYREAADAYGGALDRLVRAYELDPDRRHDLLQEIHLALWRSFEKFEARCSLRTWVYRIANNIATSYMIRQRRANSGLLSIEELESLRLFFAKNVSDNAGIIFRPAALISHLIAPLAGLTIEVLQSGKGTRRKE